MDKMTKKNDNIFCSFLLDDLEVCMNVSSIQEVVNYPSQIIKMPLAPDFLVGVFNLRNMIIPIINLKTLLKIEQQNDCPEKKVGIIDYKGAKIGLIFDKTSEIIRLGKEEVDNFSYHDDKDHVISGALKLEGGERIIQVLNPFALFEIENIPQILASQNNRAKEFELRKDLRKKCITFSVAEVQMAFEISSIHEIINLTEVKKTVLKNEYSLGYLNLRGKTVSLIDFGRLIRMKTTEEHEKNASKVIILKTEEGLFGILVNSVDSISWYEDAEIMPIPLVSKERSEMFKGCVSTPDRGDIILLDSEKILLNSEVDELRREHQVNYGDEVDTLKKKKCQLKESFISFKAKNDFGVAIKDVNEIINYPKEMVEAPNMASFVKGILNLRGDLVTIIDMRALYHITEESVDASARKILIFGKGQEKFGLVVDDVESIINVSTSEKMQLPSLMIRELKDQYADDIKEVISLELNDQKRALIILNINALSLRLGSKIAA